MRYYNDNRFDVEGTDSQTKLIYGIGAFDLGNAGKWEIGLDTSKKYGPYYKAGSGTEFYYTQLNWARPRLSMQNNVQTNELVVKTGETWNSSDGTTLSIRFKKAFAVAPAVRVWITKFSASNDRNLDINVYCFDVDREGYKLRIDKLPGHEIDKLSVAWLAHDPNERNLFSASIMCTNVAYEQNDDGSATDREILDRSLITENWASEKTVFMFLSDPYSPGQLVKFPEERFDQAPFVFVAAKRIKFHKSAYMRLTAPVVHVTKNGALVQAMTWWDSKLYEAYYEVIAYV